MLRRGGSSTSGRLVTQQFLTHAQGVGSVSFAGIEDDDEAALDYQLQQDGLSRIGTGKLAIETSSPVSDRPGGSVQKRHPISSAWAPLLLRLGFAVLQRPAWAVRASPGRNAAKEQAIPQLTTAGGMTIWSCNILSMVGAL